LQYLRTDIVTYLLNFYHIEVTV